MHAQTHSYVPDAGNGQDFYTLHNNLAQAFDKAATQYMYKWPCLIKPLIIQLPRNKSLEYRGEKKNMRNKMCKLICCCSYKRHHYHWCLCLDSATIPWQHGKQFFLSVSLTNRLSKHGSTFHTTSSLNSHKPDSAKSHEVQPNGLKAVRKGFKVSRQKFASRTCGPCNVAITMPKHHGIKSKSWAHTPSSKQV